ncbi:MAG: proton-conducting transporter membrane subunit [Gemmatimonadota bacterium]
MILTPILLPLIGAFLTFITRRSAPLIGTATAALTAASSIGVAWTVGRRGFLSYPLGDWAAPVGIALRADGLSAVMLLTSASVVLPVCVYAVGYFRKQAGEAHAAAGFWPLALLLWGGLNGLFLSGDVFNLYVVLELMTLAAVALVAIGSEESGLAAAMRYLLAAFLASMFYLLGVALLYGAYGTLDMAMLGARLVPEPAAYLAAALIAGALALKTALFPLHFWLPRAHAAAPAPVSALLSSLVVTGSFYLFLRLWTSVFAPIASVSAGQLLGILGSTAIVWGSLQALRQQHLKVMIAYSTVAQVGYLFLLFPLVTSAMATAGGADAWGVSAWNGGVYHAISHALAKAAMFLAAGTIVQALGSDRIVGISGIARQLPVTTYAFGIAGMTLIGLPPSGGFVAKWLLLSAAFASGQWWWAIVMLLGGILTAGYVFLVLGQELSQAGSDHDVEMKPVPRSMEYAAFALAFAALVLGLRVTEPLELLRIGFPFGGS